MSIKYFFVNRKPESRCPELLANYCDVLLRRNQTKKLTEEEVKEKLGNVVRINISQISLNTATNWYIHLKYEGYIAQICAK